MSKTNGGGGVPPFIIGVIPTHSLLTLYIRGRPPQIARQVVRYLHVEGAEIAKGEQGASGGCGGSGVCVCVCLCFWMALSFWNVSFLRVQTLRLISHVFLVSLETGFQASPLFPCGFLEDLWREVTGSAHHLTAPSGDSYIELEAMKMIMACAPVGTGWRMALWGKQCGREPEDKRMDPPGHLNPLVWSLEQVHFDRASGKPTGFGFDSPT